MAPTFALTPGQLQADDIVDLNSKLGRDLYNRAIEPLKMPFDGNSKNINLLQNQLQRRAAKAGWDTGLGNIMTVQNDKGEDKNIITQFGCLTTKNLKDEAGNYAKANTRAAQNNHMMVECIMSSITEECFYKISNEDEAYTVDDTKIATLLYKLLMSKAIVDTRATNYQIKHNLANLENYMTNVNSNIELFNLHVKNSKEGLKARGEQADDLIMELFKGYKAASDSTFVEYIERKEERYLLDDEDLKDDVLMHLALNLYTMRKESGEWGAPTQEQEQLTALSAEMVTLKARNNELANTFKNKRQSKEPKKDTSGKDKKQPKTKKARDNAKWAWKKIPPPQGSPKTKDVEGKTYHWCVNHQAWTIHTEAECTFEPDAPSNTSKFKQALTTVIETITDSDEE